MAKHITLPQLQTVVTGMATKNDARFLKKTQIVDSVESESTTDPASAASVKTAYDAATAAQATAAAKQDPATSLAGYGILDAYTKNEVDGKISSTYRPAGSIAGTGLVSGLLIKANVGNVYDITTDLNITAENEDLFLNLSAGDKVNKGDNVAVAVAPATYTACGASATAEEGVTYYSKSGDVYTEVDPAPEVGADVSEYYTKDADSYLFDKLSGFVDLSGVTYTEGDGIDIDGNNVVKVVVDDTSANGLSVGTDGVALAAATADTHEFALTEDTTAVAGKTYYERTGESPNYVYTEKTGLVVGTTDVSSFYEDAVATAGTGGALTAADKYKLDQFSEATAQDIQDILDGVYAS